MAGGRQILFIRGGGAGVHDQWDGRLVVSLRRGTRQWLPGPLPAPAG